MRDPARFAVTLILTALPCLAQTRDAHDYTRVLLPFHGVTAGIGNTWLTSWWYRNSGGTTVDAFPLGFSCGLPPPPVNGETPVLILGRPALQPTSTPACLGGDVGPSFAVPPYVPLVTAGTGALLYVETAGLPQVEIGGSIRWETPDRNSHAVGLRAVPESELIDGTRDIIGVAIVPGNRYALRLYAMPESAGARVTVSVYQIQPLAFAPDEVLLDVFETQLQLPPHHLRPCQGACDLPQLAYAPATAQIFNLVKPPEPGALSTVRVQIAPRSDSVRWWAVLSATDNATGNIELFEPAR